MYSSKSSAVLEAVASKCLDPARQAGQLCQASAVIERIVWQRSQVGPTRAQEVDRRQRSAVVECISWHARAMTASSDHVLERVPVLASRAVPSAVVVRWSKVSYVVGYPDPECANR